MQAIRKSFLQKGSQNLFKTLVQSSTRALSNEVTYDFKDLILDPNTKEMPLYDLYKLEEA